MSDDAVTALAFIERVAEVAEGVAFQAGVGSMETAGAIMSFLAEHPDWLGAFMNGGWFALPREMHMQGRFTWHGRDGKVYAPRDVRLTKMVQNMRPKA